MLGSSINPPQTKPHTSSLLMGTEGCKRLPISLRYSKRSASSFTLSLSIFSIASSTNKRTFLIWVTVRAWHRTKKCKQACYICLPAYKQLCCVDRKECSQSYRQNFSRKRLQVLRFFRNSLILSNWFLLLHEQQSRGLKTDNNKPCLFLKGLENKYNAQQSTFSVMLKYLHFFPDAFAAKILCFVQVVCSEAACQGVKSVTQCIMRLCVCHSSWSNNLVT